MNRTYGQQAAQGLGPDSYDGVKSEARPTVAERIALLEGEQRRIDKELASTRSFVQYTEQLIRQLAQQLGINVAGFTPANVASDVRSSSPQQPLYSPAPGEVFEHPTGNATHRYAEAFKLTREIGKLCNDFEALSVDLSRAEKQYLERRIIEGLRSYRT
jgi:hypothetical protein